MDKRRYYSKITILCETNFAGVADKDGLAVQLISSIPSTFKPAVLYADFDGDIRTVVAPGHDVTPLEARGAGYRYEKEKGK